MLAVISPSKTQDFEPTQIDVFTQTRQIEQSQVLVDLLKGKTQDDIASLMSISDKLSKLNFDRFQTFSTPFTLSNAKQALLAFKGDVYNGIDAQSLSLDDFEFAQGHLRMLSGLYGVIRPLDLIQPYRLEMGTKLKNSQGKNLYEFWGDKISKVLNEDESEVIINLASNEYFKGIDKKSINAKIVNIAFKELKNDTYKIIGIYAKRARGLMVNYMIKNRLTDPELLKGFNVEGYQFRQTMSDDLTWVFTRD
ncbi:MAG TPA: peroxide stress protein YaaA [Gammaproteobacteria bacterium]|nr:peroxide stress protein YaaA [Gammaproteobacteria bacterium]HAG47798.1 peroxide stress protein YaaA [Gammaproteobacteria bacterium]HAO38957.1 peroxide stress protein YaaA [Gammaproteobacteria bacterium]HAO70004.1 peroxide stress protein YaaA [Gammaproteobacteria bacterium]HAU19856.1 peroxide stress protein YaaA [Gammaproteobacteria bacterium]